MFARALAAQGDEEAFGLANRIAPYVPLEAELIRAELRVAQGKNEEGAQILQRLFLAYRTSPWMWTALADRALALTLALNQADRRLGPGLIEALSQPFAVHIQEAARQHALFDLSFTQPDPAVCVAALAPIEPFAFWEEEFLRSRAACYNDAKHPRAAAALEDYRRFLEIRGPRIDEGLKPEK